MIDREEFLRLHNQGLTTIQLADRFGCSKRHVTRMRAALGVTQPLPSNWCGRITEERLGRVAALLADGVSVAEVHRTLGVRPQTVVKHFPGAGWSKSDVGRYARMLRLAREKGLVL